MPMISCLPAPKTAHELEWQAAVANGGAKAKHDRLQESRGLPLEEKIEMASNSILEWYAAFKGKVAVSFSGGIDSTVLLHLVRSLHPEVPAVFVNTGLEYPEIVRFVKSSSNVTIVRPKMPFHKVIEKHGFPLVSKKVARGIRILRHPTERNANTYRLYDQGLNRFGDQVNGFRIAQRWRFLIRAPFECSDVCCDIMKKEPIHRFERESGYKQYVGILAEDSKQRERNYLMHGCNAYSIKHPRSTPLGFWTRQDILEYIHANRIPYAPIYGEIAHDGQEWRTTGVNRTGCVFCCFGLQMETDENRFQRLARSHPRLWAYCMQKIGLEDVLRYIRLRVPDSLKDSFYPYPKPRQLSMSTYRNDAGLRQTTAVR